MRMTATKEKADKLMSNFTYTYLVVSILSSLRPGS